ncbi:hypothetical protein ACJW31_07G102400 [Castanea mollissima]
MAHGHLIPTMDMAKLFAARGVKATLVTTPRNVPSFSKTRGINIDIQIIKFPAVKAGLPEGCENIDSIASSISIEMRQYEPHKKVSSDSEPFVIPIFPGEIKLTRMQLPDFIKLEVETDLSKSYGVVVNSFYELEPAYAEHYKEVMGRKAWHVGPVSLCNKDTEDKAQRRKESSIDEHECLRWLSTKKPNSVVYICFGSIANSSDSQLKEIAMGLDVSEQQFIWVVKKGKNEREEEDWLPKGFEKGMKGKGLILRGWAPQVLILDHEAVGGFVTHCGWNSTLEGVTAGVPTVTWPLSAEQFYNEKLVTQVLKIGVAVGVRQWIRVVGDIIKRNAIEKVVKQIMVGKEAEEMRGRAQVLGEMAKRAVEEEGSSYFDLNTLIEELRLHCS